MRRVISLWLPRFATDRQALIRQASIRQTSIRRGLSHRSHGSFARPLLPWRRSALADFAALPAGKRDERLHPDHGRPFNHPRAVAPFRRIEPPAPATVAADDEGHGTGAAFATIREDGGRCLLAAVNAAAAADGLAPGMALADARALLPQLITAPADAAGDAAALDRLADWCGRYTPWVAVEGTDDGAGAGLWLDVSGCAHLFDGEAALLDDLLGRLAGFGYTARAGIAATPGMAWAAARFLSERGGRAIVESGAERAALKDLPLAALRLPPALIESLAQVGLRRAGEVLALPRAALSRRFGAVLLARLDQALGRLDEPISPRQPAPPHRVRLAFPEPIAAPQDLSAGLQRLLGALCRGLAVADEGARRLELALYRVDGSVQRTGLGTSRPVRDPQALARLFVPHMERLDPGFGVEVMVLAAPATEPLGALQLVLAQEQGDAGNRKEQTDEVAQTTTPLPPLRGEGGARGEREVLAELIDCLANRLGQEAIRRCVPRQSHLPERSVEMVPPLDATDAPERWPATAPRPVRLLRAPEPVETLSPFALLQAPDCAGPHADFLPLSSPGLSGRSRAAPAMAVSGPSWMPGTSPGMPGEGSHALVEAGKRAGAVEEFDAPLLEEKKTPAAFRWRGRVHRIIRADGPERIAPEWWRRPGGAARDYYRIEDGDGRRFWLFCEIPPRVHPGAACSAPEGAGMATLTRKGSDRDGEPGAHEDPPLRQEEVEETRGEGGRETWYLHGLFA